MPWQRNRKFTPQSKWPDVCLKGSSNPIHAVHIRSTYRVFKDISDVLKYMLRLAYQLPKLDRLRRIAVSRPRENDIFIGYAAADSNFVRRLDKAIRTEGLDPWIDFDDIPNFDRAPKTRHEYAQQIEDGIFKADVFVLVLSQAALGCETTMAGLKRALHLNKLIFVVCKDQLKNKPNFPACLDRLVPFEIQSALWDKAFKRVARNIIHLQTYVRLLARSTEWDNKGRPPQYLITAEDFREVKKQIRWINTHKLGRQFQFTEVELAFLEAVESAHAASGALDKKSQSSSGQGFPDIFICYAHDNKQFVYKLSHRLEREGWQLWLDQDSIPVATDWRDEAEEGIRQAHTFFFVVCPESVQSAPCIWELERARHHNKRIIPIISQKGYSQEALESIGLSSIQYVSFVREQRTFEQALSELLTALKLHLEDLKTYRRLLVKAYEWAEQERQDRFLMNRHDYREIQHWRKQRQHLDSQDNWDIEPLISRQQEYIRASQRYLALQRKRQGLYASVILATVFGLTGLLLSTSLGEIKALVTSLDDRKGLDALVVGLRAGKKVKRNDFFLQHLRPNLRAKATTALHRTALKLREINRLEGHIGSVFDVAFSPDGQQLVSVGADKSVRFWNFRSNLSNETAFSHTDAVEAIAYSSDGHWVATGSRDGVVKLWQPSGQLQKTLPRLHKKHIYQVAFSPGSQYLATASEDGDVFLWTQADGFRNPTVLSHGADKPVFRIAFSFDGQYIASADITGQVRVWSLEGELLKTFEHDRPIFTMQFSPRKNLLAFAGVSGVIQLENLEQETTYLLDDHDGRIWQIAFSSDGATLASASDDSTVKLWTLNHPQEPTLAHTLSGHGKRVYRVRFGPQDNMLATGGADGTIRLWLRDKGTLVETLEGHKDDIWSLAFSPRLQEAEASTSLEPTSSVATNSLASFSHILASASIDGDIRLWNIDSPVQPLPHENRVFDVDFRPDGAVVASSGVNTIRLWWRRDGTLRSHIKYEEGTRVLTLDYSNPNGKLLAAGGNNGHIQIWKPGMSTHRPNQKLEQAHPVSNISSLDQGVANVQFSPNGQWLASGGSDSTLKLWRVREDDKIYRYITLPHPAGVTGLDFSADHQFLVASTRARLQPSTAAPVDSGSIVLWKMPDESQNQAVPKQIFEFSPTHHAGDILTVAINPTQPKRIASGGADGKINLWDMEGKWIRTLEGHTDEVTRVSFSKDGLFLASASRDGSIRLWMVQNGDLISVLDRHTGEVSSTVFDPGSNQTLASASFDNDVLLWQLWDLSDAEATTLNKRPAILHTLIQMGCSSAQSFLDGYDYEDKNFKQLSPDDQESINEIKEVQKFCSDHLD